MNVERPETAEEGTRRGSGEELRATGGLDAAGKPVMRRLRGKAMRRCG